MPTVDEIVERKRQLSQAAASQAQAQAAAAQSSPAPNLYDRNRKPLSGPAPDQPKLRDIPLAIAAPPPSAADRKPFAGREAALGRLFDGVKETAKTVAAPVGAIAGTLAGGAGAVVDAGLNAVAGARGLERVNPTAVQDLPLSIAAASARQLREAADKVGESFLKSVPLGETRAAPPAKPAEQRATVKPTKANASEEPRAQPKPKAAEAAKAAPADVPRGTDAAPLPGVFRDGNSFSDDPTKGKPFVPGQKSGQSGQVGGFARNLSGPSFMDNAGGLLKMADDRALAKEAAIARNNAETDANIERANNTGLRNQLQSQLNRTRPDSGRLERGVFRPRGAADNRANLQAQLAALGQPVAAAPTPTLGDLQAQQAKTEALTADANASAARAQAEGVEAQTKQRQQTLLEAGLSQLAPLDQALLAQGIDPRQQQGKFQIATQDEPAMVLDPETGQMVADPNGGTRKTAYIIDAAGNARPVSGGQPQTAANAAIPADAIAKLKGNPKLAADFDRKYGTGASAQFLN